MSICAPFVVLQVDPSNATALEFRDVIRQRQELGKALALLKQRVSTANYSY
jgi:hypothetical protein